MAQERVNCHIDQELESSLLVNQSKPKSILQLVTSCDYLFSINQGVEFYLNKLEYAAIELLARLCTGYFPFLVPQ